MKSYDKMKEKKVQLATDICKAIKEGKIEDALKLFDERDEIMLDAFKEYHNEYVAKNDAAILEKAGITQFTSEELKTAETIIKTAKESNAVGAGGVSIDAAALPNTFISRLFNEIKLESKLIKYCRVTNIGWIATMPIDNTEDDPATWTAMGETMSETAAAIDTISTMNFKLGKIIYVPNEMLDMGAAWILGWIKDKLKYCFRLGMEISIASGTGANGPVGMAMTKTKGTDASKAYYKKDAIKVTEFNQVEYPALVDELTYDSQGRARAIEKVILIVHPSTLLRKIIPATVTRNNNGEFSNMAFPFPTEVITSVAVDENEAILGIPNKYEFFIGTGANKEGKIVSDSSTKFPEHMTGLKIFMYGNGSFVDENDFKLLDVSELKEYIPKFQLVDDSAASDDNSSAQG